MMPRSKGDRDLRDIALIVDTACFLAGYITTIYGAKIFTVKEVLEEVKDAWSRERLELLLNSGKIDVLEPSKESIEKARAIASRENLLDALSETDQKLLALAIELKEKGWRVTLITDDSYLHALARKLGIVSRGVRREVPKRFKPKIYICEVCGYSTIKKIDRCPICGSPIKAA
ncbi:MAG: NOB1 family endonuclease [Sulfolobales archaeon]